MGIMGDIADVLMPRACAGCGRWDESLCRDCLGRMGQWREVSAPFLTLLSSQEDGVNSSLIPVWALGEYDAELRRVIITWKNRVDVLLSRAVGYKVRQEAEKFPRCLASLQRQVPDESIDISPGDVVDVVPAPSGWRRRHRGLFVTGCIAWAMVAGLREAGVQARYADILTRRGAPGGTIAQRGRKRRSVKVKHRGIGVDLGGDAYVDYGEYSGCSECQGCEGGGRGCDAGQESEKQGMVHLRGTLVNCVNVSHCFSRSYGAVRFQRRCIVVDDVLTTGATLSGCVYALQNKGYKVIAGAVIAAASPGI